jgi:hypothetical protein
MWFHFGILIIAEGEEWERGEEGGRKRGEIERIEAKKIGEIGNGRAGERGRREKV